MLTKISPQWILGLLIGGAMPIIGIYLITTVRPELLGMQRFDNELVKQMNVQIITLGMIINAGLFFAFLRFEKEDIGRGILAISVLYLVLIFIYRFLL